MRKDFIFELKELNVAITKKLCNTIKSKDKMQTPSPLQAKILGYLIKNTKKQIYQRDLEEVLGVSRATISEALLTMERNGIVERVISKDDARVKQIKLTKNSKKRHQEMKEKFNTLNEELLDGISDEEIEEVSSILKKMINNLKISKNKGEKC